MEVWFINNSRWLLLYREGLYSLQFKTPESYIFYLISCDIIFEQPQYFTKKSNFTQIRIPWLFPNFPVSLSVFSEFYRFSLTFSKNYRFSRFFRLSLTAINPEKGTRVYVENAVKGSGPLSVLKILLILLHWTPSFGFNLACIVRWLINEKLHQHNFKSSVQKSAALKMKEFSLHKFLAKM